MLFQWNSEYLEEYGTGYIIIEALSKEEARKKALIYFEVYDREHYESDYIDPEDWEEEIQERKKIFLKDLEKEPINNAVIFIRGTQ